MLDFSQLAIEEERPVRVSSGFSSGRNVYLSNATIISHRGSILGTMLDVNNGTIKEGTRCDCPAGHGKHTDGKGEDYAHVVKLSGGENGIHCSGSECSGLLYVMDKPREKSITSDFRDETRGNMIETNTQVCIDIISPYDAFSKFIIDEHRIQALATMAFLLDGLFVKNYHTVLWGNAGAGKTTVLIHLCFEMVDKGYKVYYMYLDGALSTAAKLQKEIIRRELGGKFNLLIDGTMSDYVQILKGFIAKKQRLYKMVFILDTFKFLSSDINHKNANKDAMHFIKEVNKLGASFISLSHSNKDGKDLSGTAEIIQDSDGVLRIDSLDNGVEIISTIKRGGRCRFDVKEQSFSFVGGDFLSVKKCDNQIDVQAESERIEQEKKDSFFIDEAKRILRLNPNIIQKELTAMLMDATSEGKNSTLKKLDRYLNKHWTRVRSDGTAISYRYSVLDKNYAFLV